MANIKSAEKRIRVTKTKTEINKKRKSEIKTYIKNFNEALENNKFEEASELLKIIDRKLKRAAITNAIHKNAASRKISHLTKELNAKKAEAI